MCDLEISYFNEGCEWNYLPKDQNSITLAFLILHVHFFHLRVLAQCSAVCLHKIGWSMIIADAFTNLKKLWVLIVLDSYFSSMIFVLLILKAQASFFIHLQRIMSVTCNLSWYHISNLPWVLYQIFASSQLKLFLWVFVELLTGSFPACLDSCSLFSWYFYTQHCLHQDLCYYCVLISTNMCS